MDVLQLDVSGRPQAWLSAKDAAVLYANDSVAWTLGDPFLVLRGGIQRRTGLQSRLELHPIVAVHGSDALGLLANCADIYARCDDTNRRLCNQAFFTKVYIDEDNELRVEHNRPFEMLLDPQVNANALTWAADANKARTSTNVSVGKGCCSHARASEAHRTGRCK